MTFRQDGGVTEPARHGLLFAFLSAAFAFPCALVAPGSILLTLLVPVGAFLAARFAAWAALRQGRCDHGYRAALMAWGFFLGLLVLLWAAQNILAMRLLPMS